MSKQYYEMQKHVIKALDDIQSGSVVSNEALLRLIASELGAVIDCLASIAKTEMSFEEEGEEKENEMPVENNKR